MLKIKCNDEVVIIVGCDKGKWGKVFKVLEGKLFISGINIVKKY